MEQGDREAKQLLHNQLKFVNLGMRIWLELIIKIVLSKCENRDKISSSANGHLDKTLAALENKSELIWLRIQRLSGTTNNNSDGSSHTLLDTS
jgi:hypothetical protein